MTSPYNRGVRDGRNNSTAGRPSTSFFATKKEISDIKDWKQGYEHGKKNR